MTTTELIDLLKKHERGAVSGRPREITLTVNGTFMPHPHFYVDSTDDGLYTGICIGVVREQKPIKANAISLGFTEVWGNWFKCSACGYEGIHESARNFCPNCGKKLEVKDD